MINMIYNRIQIGIKIIKERVKEEEDYYLMSLRIKILIYQKKQKIDLLN